MKGKAMGGIHCSLCRVWTSQQMPQQVREDAGQEAGVWQAFKVLAQLSYTNL